ncbi:hypothetical protein KC361_g180 [Hortaea werneckii]|nr:hypothetical protein KC361_g180 [Hortaea werneckii]
MHLFTPGLLTHQRHPHSNRGSQSRQLILTVMYSIDERVPGYSFWTFFAFLGKLAQLHPTFPNSRKVQQHLRQALLMSTLL